MTSKCMDFEVLVELLTVLLKDVPGGFPKSDLLGVTVALIHVVLCQLQRQLALWL